MMNHKTMFLALLALGLFGWGVSFRGFLKLATFFVLIMSFPLSSRGGQSDSPIPASVQAQLNEANKNFTFQGEPLNPLGIKLLLPLISDTLPGTASIYLEGTMKDTNQFFANSIQNKDGVVTIDLERDDHPAGSFSYQHLGTLANGWHVLEIWENSGGSGIWTDLLLVKISAEPEYKEDGSVIYRPVLTRMGMFALGDRFGGTVSVQPHKIVIRAEHASRNDTPDKTINFK